MAHLKAPVGRRASDSVTGRPAPAVGRLWLLAPQREGEKTALDGSLLHRGQRREKLPAVIYIDVDGFVAVNGDGAGHQLDDQVLQSVARRLSEAVRPADVAARVGPDEFAVVCEDLSSSADAANLAVRIRGAVESPMVVGDTTVNVHATTRVAFAVAGDDPESLLGRADLDMYTAKHHYGSPAAAAGPAVAVVPSTRRSPASRGFGGPPSAADDGPGQQLHLANWLINRVFHSSLEMHVAAMEDGHVCALFDGLVENLDRLIVDVRLEALAATHHSEGGQTADPATEIARAMETLDAALHHLDGAWSAVVASGDDPPLGDRLSHAARLTKSATRVLSGEVLY